MPPKKEGKFERRRQIDEAMTSTCPILHERAPNQEKVLLGILVSTLEEAARPFLQLSQTRGCGFDEDKEIRVGNTRRSQ